jgi:hypothetical protein
LYYLVTKNLIDFKNCTFDDEGLDELCDLENLRLTLQSYLDPYLKLQVQKRGISIIQNTYTGFDTEYELKNPRKFLNKLLSVQTALQTRTLIKIPLYNTFNISYAHPLTSEITTFFKPKNRDWINESQGSNRVLEMNLINESLKQCVKRIREVKFNSLKLINADLISLLEGIEGIDSFEDTKKDQIVFALPLTKLRTKVIFPDNGYSLLELVKATKSEVGPDLSDSYSFLISKISKNLFPFNSKKLFSWWENVKDKPRSRTSLICENGDKISLSIVKNIYLCTHYSSSDLSMLDDFQEFKTELNIVSKSFVTLGKPFNIDGVNIFVRDTVLLAPSGSKSLDAIGKLYESEGEGEGSDSKIVIPQEYREKMSDFLNKDKRAFVEYARTDAIITLKHSIAMEKFNFTIKQIGVPITISALGRNFVFEK